MDIKEIKEALELHQKWLKCEEGGQRACFLHKDLRGVDFSDYDIIHISFTGSNLERQVFENKIIDNCHFTDANLHSVRFINCEITHTQFTDAYIFDTLFTGVIFKQIAFPTNLSQASFENCTFINCTFINCTFDDQDISRTTFDSCTFDKCHFASANMQHSWLIKCKLTDCNLRAANLTGATIEQCQFKDIKVNAYTQGYSLVCPEEGSFIGYKRCRDFIVKLFITKDALRSSATTRKCRCSKAKVLSITHLDGSDAGIVEVPSNYDSDFVYKVGKIVEVPTFDKNRWEECAEGIHFFITREEAVNYIF